MIKTIRSLYLFLSPLTGKLPFRFKVLVKSLPRFGLGGVRLTVVRTKLKPRVIIERQSQLSMVNVIIRLILTVKFKIP